MFDDYILISFLIRYFKNYEIFVMLALFDIVGWFKKKKNYLKKLSCKICCKKKKITNVFYVFKLVYYSLKTYMPKTSMIFDYVFISLAKSSEVLDTSDNILLSPSWHAMTGLIDLASKETWSDYSENKTILFRFSWTKT